MKKEKYLIPSADLVVLQTGDIINVSDEEKNVLGEGGDNGVATVIGFSEFGF